MAGYLVAGELTLILAVVALLGTLRLRRPRVSFGRWWRRGTRVAGDTPDGRLNQVQGFALGNIGLVSLAGGMWLLFATAPPGDLTVPGGTLAGGITGSGALAVYAITRWELRRLGGGSALVRSAGAPWAWGLLSFVVMQLIVGTGFWIGVVLSISTATDSTPPTQGRAAWEYIAEGNRLLSAEQYDQARLAFSTAIDLDPASATAYDRRGVALYRLGQLGAALDDLERAVDLDPTSAATWSDRGAVYEALGEDRLAIADYTNAIALAPSDPRRFVERAEVYTSEREYDLAIADLSRAIELAPDEAIPYALRGRIRAALGDIDGAKADLDRALRLATDLADRSYVEIVRHEAGLGDLP